MYVSAEPANTPLRKLINKCKLIVIILETSQKNQGNRELIVIGKRSYSGRSEHLVLKCNFCSWEKTKQTNKCRKISHG